MPVEIVFLIEEQCESKLASLSLKLTCKRFNSILEKQFARRWHHLVIDPSIHDVPVGGVPDLEAWLLALFIEQLKDVVLTVAHCPDVLRYVKRASLHIPANVKPNDLSFTEAGVLELGHCTLDHVANVQPHTNEWGFELPTTEWNHPDGWLTIVLLNAVNLKHLEICAAFDVGNTTTWIQQAALLASTGKPAGALQRLRTVRLENFGGNLPICGQNNIYSFVGMPLVESLSLEGGEGLGEEADPVIFPQALKLTRLSFDYCTQEHEELRAIFCQTPKLKVLHYTHGLVHLDSQDSHPGGLQQFLPPHGLVADFVDALKAVAPSLLELVLEFPIGITCAERERSVILGTSRWPEDATETNLQSDIAQHMLLGSLQSLVSLRRLTTRSYMLWSPATRSTWRTNLPPNIQELTVNDDLRDCPGFESALIDLVASKDEYVSKLRRLNLPRRRFERRTSLLEECKRAKVELFAQDIKLAKSMWDEDEEADEYEEVDNDDDSVDEGKGEEDDGYADNHEDQEGDEEQELDEDRDVGMEL